jgi:hypothetical protein
MTRDLWSGFMRSAEQFPERAAVVVDGASLSYLSFARQRSASPPAFKPIVTLQALL